jgi:hypothetical protein
VLAYVHNGEKDNFFDEMSRTERMFFAMPPFFLFQIQSSEQLFPNVEISPNPVTLTAGQSRVTRWVSEKIAQNVAQPIICRN